VGKRVLQYQLEWEFSRPLRAFPGRAGGIHIGRGRIPAGERIGLTELRTLPVVLNRLRWVGADHGSAMGRRG
jgi:hypothetical protein